MEHTTAPWTLVCTTNEFEIPEIGLSWLRSHATDQMEDAKIKNSELGQTEQANARFIVKAVNCHDELLEACKEAQKAFKAVCKECKENCVEVMICGVRGAIAEINKAIAKAEGR